MSATPTQLWAASALVTALEKIIADNLITDELREARLRILINDACRVFQLPTIAERPAESNVRVFRR